MHLPLLLALPLVSAGTLEVLPRVALPRHREPVRHEDHLPEAVGREDPEDPAQRAVRLPGPGDEGQDHGDQGEDPADHPAQAEGGHLRRGRPWSCGIA